MSPSTLSTEFSADTCHLSKIISDCLFKPVENISVNDSLVYDLHVDSMVLTEIVVSIEDFFEIDITTDEAEDFVSVGDIATLVHEKLARKRQKVSAALLIAPEQGA
ncbi:acyl carrier protein [Pantoea sp. SORGH_AS_0659]|uniref:acyl carrier protein n=1 Tax=Pantoea sp. SORGH_AS_0659 TaxID=3062597 RepID=UPI002857B972|nr:acyl carrier protein [Pantoea sp. SORGH_AS_0659]MDR6352534.1 acyl carrier protein [Pantoea sp. SORGH_AS_0659]